MSGVAIEHSANQPDLIARLVRAINVITIIGVSPKKHPTIEKYTIQQVIHRWVLKLGDEAPASLPVPLP
jgi:hypothetical protein